MARLERAAADRYRAWAATCLDPAASEGLRACAGREEEVAARVETRYPPQLDELRYFSEALPTIAESAELEELSAEFREALLSRRVRHV